MDISESLLNYFLIPAVKAVVVVILVATAAGILTYIERRTLAFLQVRKGPNRVGPEGILQFVADVVKLLTKEDVVPAKAQHFIHFLAPVLVMVPGLAVFAVLPWGPEFTMRIPGLGKITTAWYAADLNVSLLLVLAITSIGVYGIILGGWASNSKYALLGGLRSAAQLISYEVPMGFAVVSAILMARSLSLVEIVEAQRAHHMWFILPGLVAFLLYFISGVAETNRIPFDLPEAESELVAGFHTEYSGFRWAIFFLTEYANMITISAVATALFFGGWLRPFPSVKALAFLDVDAGRPLVRPEGRGLPLRLHLVPRDLPALPVRPAHGARVEDPHPDLPREPRPRRARGARRDARPEDPRHGPLGRRRRRLPHRDPAQGGEAARGEDGSGARGRPGGGGLT